MKVFVTGAGGMVGRAVVEHCMARGDEVFAYDHQRLDVTDAAAIRDAFARDKPETTINCAAWTDVDGCETDHKRAYLINDEAVGLLAANCRQSGASFVTISTDYVFDGAKDGFYTQRDDPNPTSVYGQAKLAGERRAQSACARTTIVRTGWIFGREGRNFLSKVFDYARSGQTLKAIEDGFGTPTYAPDLARRLRELAQLDLPGIYHVVNAGAGTSYADFTRRALVAAQIQGVKLESVSMNSLQRPAPRPRNSRLRCLLSEAINLSPLQNWESALNDFARRFTDTTASVAKPLT
ncbi:MAG: dTDP-4-dehydrorhamnose reductase [Pyrinomonadaceae bacterium]|nr:dTDP-4-dehydrorhamnose reductase [Pyrinomonadaceae bacterium]